MGKEFWNYVLTFLFCFFFAKYNFRLRKLFFEKNVEINKTILGEMV